MREPYQILAIPYRMVDGSARYCVFHRSDADQWQFIAGGGEDGETPLEAAKREVLEESGVQSDDWVVLKSLSFLPAATICETCRQHWDRDILVIPEYTFGFACREETQLSNEHTECIWLPYEQASEKLRWDSNRTALYELNCRLKIGREV